MGVADDWRIILRRDVGAAVVAHAQDASAESEADRLATLGCIAAGVAHEINNPLACVVTNLSVLARSLPALVRELGALREKAEGDAAVGAAVEGALARAVDLGQILKLAQEGADQVRVLAADLRTLSRPDDGPNGFVDVRRVLDSCLNVARGEIARRTRLTLDYEDVPLFAASEAALGRLFFQLLWSALEAMPRGEPCKNLLRVATRGDADGFVLVELSDSGPTVDRDENPVIVRCGQAVTALGGQLVVDVLPGGGTIVRVALPIDEGASEPVSGTRPGPPAA